jgi:hypothetical protein
MDRAVVSPGSVPRKAVGAKRLKSARLAAGTCNVATLADCLCVGGVGTVVGLGGMLKD